MPGMNPGQQNPISIKFNQHQQQPDGSTKAFESIIQVNSFD